LQQQRLGLVVLVMREHDHARACIDRRRSQRAITKAACRRLDVCAGVHARIHATQIERDAVRRGEPGAEIGPALRMLGEPVMNVHGNEVRAIDARALGDSGEEGDGITSAGQRDCNARLRPDVQGKRTIDRAQHRALAVDFSLR